MAGVQPSEQLRQLAAHEQDTLADLEAMEERVYALETQCVPDGLLPRGACFPLRALPSPARVWSLCANAQPLTAMFLM